MTRPDGTPDPGAPDATDEEAVDEKFAQEAPVAPEAEIVADGESEVSADEVEDAAEAAADAGAADGAEETADGLADAGQADAGQTGGAAELQAQLDERTSDLQRVSAEFANYRRRIERDRQATIDGAKGAVLAELLPLVDDLDRAREHGDLEEGPLKVFSDKLRALLNSQKVEAFGEEGDPFDPALHEAVQDESEGSDPVLGTVLRKGYRLGDRTLRTAMVIVR